MFLRSLTKLGNDLIFARVGDSHDARGLILLRFADRDIEGLLFVRYVGGNRRDTVIIPVDMPRIGKLRKNISSHGVRSLKNERVLILSLRHKSQRKEYE